MYAHNAIISVPTRSCVKRDMCDDRHASMHACYTKRGGITHTGRGDGGVMGGGHQAEITLMIINVPLIYIDKDTSQRYRDRMKNIRRSECD